MKYDKSLPFFTQLHNRLILRSVNSLIVQLTSLETMTYPLHFPVVVLKNGSNRFFHNFESSREEHVTPAFLKASFELPVLTDVEQTSSIKKYKNKSCLSPFRDLLPPGYFRVILENL